MDDKISIGKRIKQRREQMGLTQEELANKANISRSALANYESGVREPRGAILVRLAEALETSSDYLLGHTSDSRPIEEIAEEAKHSPEIQAAHRRIEEALTGDPDAEELLAFWREMKERENLFLLFKQVRPLSDDSIRRVIRVIKAIEDDEAREFGD